MDKEDKIAIEKDFKMISPPNSDFFQKNSNKREILINAINNVLKEAQNSALRKMAVCTVNKRVFLMEAGERRKEEELA